MMVILMIMIMGNIGRKNQAIISLQELQSIELKAREIALGDEGYFAFHFQVKQKHMTQLTQGAQYFVRFPDPIQ